MKKIIAMAVTALLFLSASFALDFEIGARGILGRNLDAGSFTENLNAAKEDKTFDFGFGAYANLALIIEATCLILSAFATDEPPNFITIIKRSFENYLIKRNYSDFQSYGEELFF